jgi:dihydropteroate synthase
LGLHFTIPFPNPLFLIRLHDTARKHVLNAKGRPLAFSRPLVMGILNTTPDSFYDGGRYGSIDLALRRTEQMVRDGAAIIDVGGASSRPGADEVPLDAERERVLPVVEAIAKAFPEILVSVDTYRSAVAREALEAGAHLLNDISAGRFDPEIFNVAARAGAPMVLMHLLGTPRTMQDSPSYGDVVVELVDFFLERIHAAREAGVTDLIVDPGFGFGKTVAHNFELLRRLADFQVLNLPLLVGISRKSFIYKTLSVGPEQALNGTSVLHGLALERGAGILRVHDVREAVEAIALLESLGQGKTGLPTL